MTLIPGFYRNGTPAGQLAAERFDRRGKAANEVTEPVTCGRCGGAGGADKWRATGWTCFDCGGNGKIVKTFQRPIYTADRLAALNAATAKRQATAAAKRQALHQKAEADRAAFMAAHAEWLAGARPYAARSDFIADVLSRFESSGQLTDGQRQAVDTTIAKMLARDTERRAKAEASQYLGQVGDRVKFAAVVESARFVRVDDYSGDPTYAITLRTDAGAAVTYFGFPKWLDRHLVDLGRWNERAEYEIRTGNRVTLAATIKELRIYKNEKQTVVSRPKEIKPL